MRTKLRIWVAIMLLLFTANTFAQRSNMSTNRVRHADPIRPLNPMGSAQWEWGIRCDCPSQPIMEKPTKIWPDIRDRRWTYKDYVCTNCSTMWEIKTNSKTNEILRGPYIPIQQQIKSTGAHEANPDSCYTINSIKTVLTQIINGVVYNGTIIEVKSHCKHDHKLYILIKNKISGELYYRMLGLNDCGGKLEYGDHQISFTHYPKKIENAIGKKIVQWERMPYCQEIYMQLAVDK